MSRKDIVIISVLINAGLLVILLISALTSKEETAVMQPSVEIASSILEKNPEGMAQPLYDGSGMQTDKNAPLAFEPVKEDASGANPLAASNATLPEEKIVHALPAMTEELGQTSITEEQVVAKVKEVTVRKNDTLDKIAKRNHTTVAKLKKINHLKGSFLKIGQKIKLPSAVAAKAAVEEKTTSEMARNIADAGPEFYTVKCGDNLWTVAMKNHLKVSDLLKINSLSAEKAKRLKPGDKIRIR